MIRIKLLQEIENQLKSIELADGEFNRKKNKSGKNADQDQMFGYIKSYIGRTKANRNNKEDCTIIYLTK